MTLRQLLLSSASPVPYLSERSQRIVDLAVKGRRHMLDKGYLPEQVASRDPWQLAGIGAQVEADRMVRSGFAKTLIPIPRPANDDGLIPGEAADL